MPTISTIKLVLASASPRRLELLRQIGLEPDAVEPSAVDESVRPGEDPRDLARRLARETTFTDGGYDWSLNEAP